MIPQLTASLNHPRTLTQHSGAGKAVQKGKPRLYTACVMRKGQKTAKKRGTKEEDRKKKRGVAQCRGTGMQHLTTRAEVSPELAGAGSCQMSNNETKTFES